MDDIIFTQHALDRYMERSKINDINKAMLKLYRLGQKVQSVGKEKYIFGNEVLIIRRGIIKTYFKIDKSRSFKLQKLAI